MVNSEERQELEQIEDVRPNLTSLLRNNREAHIVIVKPHPRDLADGGEGCREFCECLVCVTMLGWFYILVNVLIFLNEVLNRIVARLGLCFKPRDT